MANPHTDPRNKREDKGYEPNVLPDVTPRREGGDDALAEKVESDSAADQKVIDNTSGAQAVVNSSGGTQLQQHDLEGSDRDGERVE